MTNKYLDQLTTLLKTVSQKLFTAHNLQFKNVFGAVGGYVNGKIFTSCGNFGLALRLPQDTINLLLKNKKAKHFKYFPNGHIKKEYVVLSKEIIENKKLLKKLIVESIEYMSNK